MAPPPSEDLVARAELLGAWRGPTRIIYVSLASWGLDVSARARE